MKSSIFSLPSALSAPLVFSVPLLRSTHFSSAVRALTASAALATFAALSVLTANAQPVPSTPTATTTPPPATAAKRVASAAPKASAKAAPAKFNAASALNRAARQPMLAERITKSFNMIGQKVLETRARRQLDESLKEFAGSLKELQAISPTPEIRDNYDLLEQLFGEFKTITAKPINLTSAKELAEQNEELVFIAQKGSMLLQAHAKSTQNDLIATAGDVRTLSQRIAKLYLFRSWGIRTNVIADDLKKAEAEYRADMDRLLRVALNSEQVKSELALSETQWLFLKQGIDRLNANKSSPTELEFVAKSCDNILEVMERVTKLYEAMKTQ